MRFLSCVLLVPVILASVFTCTSLGQTNRALTLDGIDDYVLISDAPALRLTNGSYSVTARFFLDSFQSDEYASTLVAKRSGSNMEGCYLGIGGLLHPSTPQLVTFRRSDGTTSAIHSSESTTTNAWHHIGIVYDASAGSLAMYIDGTLDHIDTGWSSPASRDGMLYLGRDSAASRYHLDGSLDEVCFWDVALASNEVSALVNTGPTGTEDGLIACWNFDDGTATDSTGNGHHGLLVNGATTVVVPPDPVPCSGVSLNTRRALAYSLGGSETDVVYQLEGRDSPFTEDWYGMDQAVAGDGAVVYLFEPGPGPVFIPSRRVRATRTGSPGSLLFDGVDDMASTAPSTLLDLTGGMTLEAWVYPLRTDGGTIVAKALSDTITCYNLSQDGDGHASFRLFDETGNPLANVRSANVIPTDAWSHLAATYNGTEARLYVNGTLNSSTGTAGTLRTHPGAPVQIGSIYGTHPLRGILDEVRVWGMARNATHIYNAMNAELLLPATGLAAYWRMDESAVQEVTDWSGQGHTLTLGIVATADSGDPAWDEASFVSQPWYQNITSFGLPCIGISWLSIEGATYQVQTRDNLSTGNWIDEGPPVSGLGLMEYFDPPTHVVRVLRVNANYQGDCTGPTRGLVAHYPFAGDANDASGHGHHGTASGTTPTTDRHGTPASAFAFDGTSYVAVPQDDELEFGTNDFTVACWFSSTVRKVHGLVGYGDRDHGAGWTFSSRPDAGTQIVMIIDDGSRTVTVQAVPGYDLYDGAFHHVAATLERDGACTLYIDGVSVAAASITHLGSLDTDNHDDLQIGRYWWSQEYNPTYYHVGAIDEVMLYDRALSAPEVSQLAGQ